uniref:Tret1-1_1 protein n=1 Tax=Fopius arisanus TaxID=64838 RepID=A0A0C9R6Y3_9HYME
MNSLGCRCDFSEESKQDNLQDIPQSNVRQFNLNLVSLCLGAASIGLTLGWPESSITYHVNIIKCDDICYDLSNDGSSTIHMIVNLGSCLGALVPACLVNISGRRHSFCISAISSIIFWLILGIARDNITLMLGAAVGGFSAGLFIVTSTMYVGEVSSPDQRGIVGSLAAFFAYLGIVISTTISSFHPDQLIPLLMCTVSVGFLLTIYFWMIESPYYIYETGKVRASYPLSF